MANVKLYKMTSDPLYYIKEKELIVDTDCDFKAPIDVEKPTIIIRGKYDHCNYFFIPHFKRYYFVESCIGLSDNLIQLTGISDVLSSNNILNITATVERQERKRNIEIVDNELIAQANTNFICKQVGNKVNDGYMIYLTTCGGV